MYAKFFKRFLDFWLSLLALIALSPLLLVLTVSGAIAMRGNPFFVQLRPGRISRRTGEERMFRLMKFRTMSNARGRDGRLLPDEVRLNSRYGRFLRSASLDELPELLNIIKGDMSLVGPRPLLPEYLPYYTEEERRRHDVRPGLTGYAQVHGRSAAIWEDRFRMDVWYVEHISLRVDLRILLDTVWNVLARKDVALNAMENFDEYRAHSLADLPPGKQP